MWLRLLLEVTIRDFTVFVNATRNRKWLGDWYCDPFRAPRERRWYSKCDFFYGDSLSLRLPSRNFASFRPNSPFKVSHQASPCWRWHFACSGVRLATITKLKTRFWASFQLFSDFTKNPLFCCGFRDFSRDLTLDSILEQLAGAPSLFSEQNNVCSDGLKRFSSRTLVFEIFTSNFFRSHRPFMTHACPSIVLFKIISTVNFFSIFETRVLSGSSFSAHEVTSLQQIYIKIFLFNTSL